MYSIVIVPNSSQDGAPSCLDGVYCHFWLVCTVVSGWCNLMSGWCVLSFLVGASYCLFNKLLCLVGSL